MGTNQRPPLPAVVRLPRMNSTLVLALDSPVPTTGPGLSRPSLKHCLLLAALLHLWLVALVGTTPGGSALPGEGVWSTIQVRLSGPGEVDSPGRADAAQPTGGPVGQAPEARFGGTVREALPRPSPEPGAARLGPWATHPAPGATPAEAPAARPLVDPSPTGAPPPVLSRQARPAADRNEDPAAPPAAAPAAPEPIRPPVDRRPAPSTAPRLAPVDTVEAPVLERPPQSLRDIANPAPTPTAVARPQPAPAPQHEERVSAPVTLPAPPAPRPVPLIDAGAPLAAPVPLSLPPAEPPAPEPVRAVAPPPARATAPEAPAPVAPPIISPPEPRPLPPLVPPSPVDVGPALRGAASDISLPPVRAADPAPSALPSVTGVRDSVLPLVPPLAPPVAPGGAPDAGPRPGVDRAQAPAATASAPRLNLELPRARATLPGLVAPRVLNLVPPPPERKSTLADSIEKAAKTDCRKAYSGMGPLAVLPLAVDALRDGGCRW
jgi:hypothetical protein